jgi:hypothetical protein
MSAENEALVRRYVEEVYDQRRITRWTARGTPGRAYEHSANRQPHKRDNPGYLARTRR